MNATLIAAALRALGCVQINPWERLWRQDRHPRPERYWLLTESSVLVGSSMIALRPAPPAATAALERLGAHQMRKNGNDVAPELQAARVRAGTASRDNAKDARQSAKRPRYDAAALTEVLGHLPPAKSPHRSLEAPAEASADQSEASWQDRARGMIADVADRGGPFTAHEVRCYAYAEGLPPPADPRAWGGAFKRAEREGLIQRTGRWHIGGRECHNRPQRVWEPTDHTPDKCRATPEEPP